MPAEKVNRRRQQQTDFFLFPPSSSSPSPIRNYLNRHNNRTNAASLMLAKAGNEKAKILKKCAAENLSQIKMDQKLIWKMSGSSNVSQWLFCLAVALTASLASCQQRSPVIQTRSGPVRGRLLELSPVLQVYEFIGIPYAEAPIGQYRFRKPVAKLSWGREIFDATKLPNACPQLPFGIQDPNGKGFAGYDRWTPKARQSEDCLTLNIWTPKSIIDALMSGPDEPPKTLSVFTFIHGGEFNAGATSMSMYNGSVLAAYNNIVVASMQYRLGSLGFAYLGTEEVPGNMGLWDQLEAMKWLCENIGSFGGNCSETTLAGESAGAVSVTFHLLSPYSRQYFKRVIVESGAAICPWAIHTPGVAKTVTSILQSHFAPKLCNQTIALSNIPPPIGQQISCLRSVDSSLFPMTDLAITLAGYGLAFVPVIDGDFIPKDPGKMLATGEFYRVPMLIGANKDEGSMFLAGDPEAMTILPMPTASDQSSLKGLNFTHYNLLLASAFRMAVGGSASKSINPLIFGAIQLHYWPTRHEGLPAGTDVVKAAVSAYGDYLLACPTYTWAQLVSSFPKMGNQVFAYYFTQRRKEHVWPAWMGVMHGDELSYVFGEPFLNYGKYSGFSNDDKKLSRIIMAYWANFVKFGDPNVRDISTPNINNGPLQQRPWPSFVGPECEFQFVELSSLVQVYNYGDGLICGLKARDCLFWHVFFPKLAGTLEALGQDIY